MSKPTTQALMVVLREAPTVREQPIVRMAGWAIHEIRQDMFLIGWNMERDCPRYTTPIVNYDRQARTVLTQSGRCYQLIGEPGPSQATLLAWELSCHLGGETSVDVTQQLLNPQ